MVADIRLVSSIAMRLYMKRGDSYEFRAALPRLHHHAARLLDPLAEYATLLRPTLWLPRGTLLSKFDFLCICRSFDVGTALRGSWLHRFVEFWAL